MRGYVKYDNEIRSGRNIKQIIRRAMQIAHSDPQGPVYLMAAREVLEEKIPLRGGRFSGVAGDCALRHARVQC